LNELSGLEVMVTVRELSESLKDTYVADIYSLGESQILKMRRAGGGEVWVIISPRHGSWVTKTLAERAETTNFTSRLRSELSRARFQGMTQVDLDRVYHFDFGEAEDRRQLFLELMPPGNMVVTDSEGRVVLALRPGSSSRRFSRGARYVPPEQRRLTPDGITGAAVSGILEREDTAGRAIGRNLAIPRRYVRETLSRMGAEEETPSAEIVGTADRLAEVLRGLVNEARESPKPCICTTQDGDEFFAVIPSKYKPIVTANTMSELCDSVFLPTLRTEAEEMAATGNVTKEVEASTKKLREKHEELLSQAAVARRAAAKAAAASTMQEALEALESVPGLEHGGRLPKSQAAVSSLLFDRAKELEASAEEVSAAEKRIARKAKKAVTRVTNPIRELRKVKGEWYEKFRWFITSGGRLAVGGRDAQSNTLLVRRHLDDEDVVYHADLFGSPFFILKGGRQQSDVEVSELAQATVSFSSGWKTGLGAADAYWVSKDQVSSTAESGEYLPKGSFVVRGKKNFVRHALLQVALGLDEKGRVVAGPESAVGRMCPRYVVLVPHREKQSDTAKRVLKELGVIGGPASAAALDDVIRALPPGGGKVTRKMGGPEAADKP
jgi:predicted ribosome quality control (RQC) complex YloA/Tae2 family protein